MTWIGTMLTVVGLILTFIQARAARKASELAAEAAQKAVRLMEGKSNLVNLAFSYAQIGLVKSLMNTGSLQAAQMVFYDVRRVVLESLFLLRERTDLADEIKIMHRNLATAETQIDRALTGKSRYKPQLAARALSGIALFLASREQEIKHSQPNA